MYAPQTLGENLHTFSHNECEYLEVAFASRGFNVLYANDSLCN